VEASCEAAADAVEALPQVAIAISPIAMAYITRIAEKIQPTVLLSRSAYRQNM
jgi:hypothetical protein